MPTERQKLAVKRISENLRVNPQNFSLGKSLKEAGYSKQVQLKPKLVTESKGFIELCNEILPDKELLKMLKDDLKARPADRSRELTIAFKIKGKMVDKQEHKVFSVTQNLDDNTFNDILKAYSSHKKT